MNYETNSPWDYTERTGKTRGATSATVNDPRPQDWPQQPLFDNSGSTDWFARKQRGSEYLQGQQGPWSWLNRLARSAYASEPASPEDASYFATLQMMQDHTSPWASLRRYVSGQD